MFTSFLIKYAEIGIKGKNRYLFEDALVKQIRHAVKKLTGEFEVYKTNGRIFVDAENLMTNHERGKKRPTYFTIKDNDILWFIPLSSKVEKYQKIIDKKMEKYGFCNTIFIRKILEEDSVILFQNAFPTLEKY